MFFFSNGEFSGDNFLNDYKSRTCSYIRMSILNVLQRIIGLRFHMCSPVFFNHYNMMAVTESYDTVLCLNCMTFWHQFDHQLNYLGA